MKKKCLFVLAAALMFVHAAHSQTSAAGDDTYKVGTNVVSAGIGLGSSIGDFTYGSQTPGISVQYERGLWKAGPGVISLGGYVGFKSFSYDYASYGDNFDYKWNYTIIGVRGAYHLTNLKVDKLDLYGGLMLSYDALSFSDGGAGGTVAYGSSMGLTAFVGCRYYFAKNLGAFAELGYGVSYLNLGLALKF
jgi:hypothetical protein